MIRKVLVTDTDTARYDNINNWMENFSINLKIYKKVHLLNYIRKAQNKEKDCQFSHKKREARERGRMPYKYCQFVLRPDQRVQFCIFSCHSPACCLVSAHRLYALWLVTRSKKHLSSAFLGAPGGILTGGETPFTCNQSLR